jgi:hypothetical protein
MNSGTLTVCLSSLFLASCATTPVCTETLGLKSITECRAADGARICLQKLKGSNHQAVRKFLGRPDRIHDTEEYLYYPERADGSIWLLLVSFAANNRVCAVMGKELPLAPGRGGGN